jgi:hypothetical protein
LNLAILDSVTAPESATIVYSDNGTKSSGRIAPPTNFFISRLRSDLSDSLIGSAMFTSVLRGEPSASLGIDNLCPNGKARAPDGRCTHDATTAELDLRYTSPGSSWLAFGSLFGSVMSGGPTRTLRDGTPIGPGDAGLGWLAQAANTTGHWTNELFYLAFSPRLDLNDAGIFNQQNSHNIRFDTGWREFNRGPTRKIFAGIQLWGFNSWDRVCTYRLIDLLTQIDWNNLWYAEFHLKRFPTIFDNRETTDGARTEKGRLWEIDWTWRTDRTRRLYSELTGWVRTTWQGYALHISESAVFRPSRVCEISLQPTLDRVTGDWRWVISSRDCQLLPTLNNLNSDGSRTY